MRRRWIFYCLYLQVLKEKQQAAREITNQVGVISRAARWLENLLFLIKNPDKYKQETTQQHRI